MTRYNVVSVNQYQNPYAANPNVMDVHLQAANGSQAKLVGIPAIAHEDEAVRRTLLEKFKGQEFVIGLSEELPLTDAPKAKAKTKTKAKAK